MGNSAFDLDGFVRQLGLYIKLYAGRNGKSHEENRKKYSVPLWVELKI